jgi:catechol 2,3-dioxygenase-like lactoylglutathione lyase family enzyme
MPDPSSSPNARRPICTNAVSPNQFAHLALRTPRFAEMSRFYLTLLNGTPAFENDLMLFIRYDHEHHRVVVINTPMLKVPQERMAGLAHFAFTYRTIEELLGNRLRMKAAGYEPCWCINHGFTTSIYFYDPDGNLVETQYDNMTVPEADAFLRSDYFTINPIGVDFDPVCLTERFMRGDPVSELIKLGSAPFPEDIEPVRPGNLVSYDYRGKLLDAGASGSRQP